MKTIKEIAEMAEVSRTVIYRRISRLDEERADDYLPIYKSFGGVPKRLFPDDEVQKLVNGALPGGRPRKNFDK